MSWDDTGTRPENPAKRLILLLSRLLTLPEFQIQMPPCSVRDQGLCT